MSSPEGSVHGDCAPRFAAVRERFAHSFGPDGEMGAALAVYLDGEPVVDLWGGYKDAAGTRPWGRDTLVHVASTTKGMTTLCLHRLVQDGRLDLEAPVSRYWPEFAQAGKQTVPVHMLLSHRAGLPAVRAPLPGDAKYDWERMTRALAAETPWWEPGTKHGYHAMTFGWLVGEVLRRIDGRSVGAFFREEVAGPLGIDFHIGLDPADDARCAEVIPVSQSSPKNPLYEISTQGDSLPARVFTNPPSLPDEFNAPAWRRAEIPAGNGHGTARAVAKVYGALARGGEIDGVHVLSAQAIERATREQAFGPDAVLLGYPMRYGLGFFLTHRHVPFGPNPRAFGHPGMGGSLGFADPDARLGFGYVMNRSQSGVAGDARGFALVAAVYDCLSA
jgi:CubicO group peptidase (beta-lactamase class C family)